MSRSETDMNSSMGRIQTLLAKSSATTVTDVPEANKTTGQSVISIASATQTPKTSSANPAPAATQTPNSSSVNSALPATPSLLGNLINKASAITTDSTPKSVNPEIVTTRQSTGTPPPQLNAKNRTTSSFYIGTPADLHKLRTEDDVNRLHGGNTDSAVNAKKVASNPKRRTMGF